MRQLQNRVKAGVMALALTVAQIVVPVAPVFAANNGTLKLHELNTPVGTESNSPQVCAFNFEGYEFDNGQTGMISIAAQGGDSDTTDTLDIPFGPANAAGYAETGYVNNGGSLQLDNGHYKSTLFGKDTNGQYTIDLKAKSKTFKVECAPATISVSAVNGSFVDPCGPSFNASFNARATTGVTYTPVVSGNTINVTATANQGYTLSNPDWSQNFTDQLIACPKDDKEVTAVNGTFNDICGDEFNLAFTAATTEGVTYNSVKTGNTIRVTATANTGYVLSNPDWSQSQTDELKACRVPTQCTVSNKMYDRVWSFDGDNYPEAGASPAGIPGSFDFEDEGLYINTPAKESYVTGFFDGGDTPLVDVDAMGYKVLRQEKSAGVPVTLPAYILSVDTNGLDDAGGQTYFFYEPYYNDGARAAVEGTFQTWDAYMNGDAKWYRSGTDQKLESWKSLVAQFPEAVVLAHGFNQGTYNAETYAVVQDIVFDCATISFRYFQGMGGGETPKTPVEPVVPVVETVQGQGAAGQLPAELPMTGAGGTISTWFALLAAVLTYGAVLFLQPKKRLEE